MLGLCFATTTTNTSPGKQSRLKIPEFIYFFIFKITIFNLFLISQKNYIRKRIFAVARCSVSASTLFDTALLYIYFYAFYLIFIYIYIHIYFWSVVYADFKRKNNKKTSCIIICCFFLFILFLCCVLGNNITNKKEKEYIYIWMAK